MTTVLPPTRPWTSDHSPKQQTISYNEVRTQLAELNYLYPFSEDSIPLIQALLGDLVSAVTSFKDLEQEHEITKEELRLAVEEINRIGVIENPKLIRDKNELHVKLVKVSQEADEKISNARKESLAAQDRSMKLELMVNQLRFENGQLKAENSEIRTRIDQLLVCEPEPDMVFVSPEPIPAEVYIDSGVCTVIEENCGVSQIGQLRSENDELHSVLSKLSSKLTLITQQYGELETKFLQQSPVTLSGNWVGGLGNASGQAEVIQQLNDRIDFLNDKYRELKQLHARCGIVSDNPLSDLRESRKELNMMAVRLEKLKAENMQLKSQRDKKPAADTPSKKKTQSCAVATEATETRQIEGLKREIKTLESDLKLKEKEIKVLKSTASPVKAGGDNRRLVGEVALLEEKLSQVTKDRDELLEKLDEIDRSIQAMEVEVIKIEKENEELKREKLAKEESFVGISKQLEEVNLILNSLTEDMSGSEEIERLRFRVTQLEKEIKSKNDEISKMRSNIERMHKDEKLSDANRSSILEKQVKDLEALTRSLTNSKDQLVAQLKTVQAELNEKRIKLDQVSRMSDLTSTAKRDLESEISNLKNALSNLDIERDELQRICDEQSEKIDILRQDASNARREASETSRSLSQSRQETDRLRLLIEEKEHQLNRLSHLSADLERKEVQVRTIEADLMTARREIAEVTRDNQSLATEVSRLRAGRENNESIMQSLRLTEKERNDVLCMYRQTISENKSIGSNMERIAMENAKLEDMVKLKESELVKATKANQQLLAQCKQTEVEIASFRAKIFDGTHVHVLETQNLALNEQIKDLVALVELERSNKGSAVDSQNLAELERTIEQQYILIGEMDTEQAKLMLENTRLREQLLQE